MLPYASVFRVFVLGVAPQWLWRCPIIFEQIFSSGFCLSHRHTHASHMHDFVALQKKEKPTASRSSPSKAIQFLENIHTTKWLRHQLFQCMFCVLFLLYGKARKQVTQSCDCIKFTGGDNRAECVQVKMSKQYTVELGYTETPWGGRDTGWGGGWGRKSNTIFK